MPDTTTSIARRLIAAFEAGDESVVDELVHPAYRDHAAAGGTGPDRVRESIRWISETFGDRSFTPEDIVADGDRVAARVRFEATLVGELEGRAPTGRRCSVQHVHFWRVADGKVAEHWMVRDDVTAMQQFGLLPEPVRA